MSERAARRYVAVLREAGIPVESVRGPYGGYRVGRAGLRLPPMVFTASRPSASSWPYSTATTTRATRPTLWGARSASLVRSLPESVAAQADAVRRVTAPAPDRSAVRADAATTRARQACAGRRRARLRYRSQAGAEWAVDVDPWAVVVRHGRWYLLCWSHQADALRAYRVDRVLEVAELPETFDPPPDLDPVALLEAHLAVGWEHEAEVVIEAPVEDVAPCVPPGIGRLEPLDAATTRLVGEHEQPAVVCRAAGRRAGPLPRRRGNRGPRCRARAGRRLLRASERSQFGAAASRAASTARSSSSVRPAPRGTSRPSS